MRSFITKKLGFNFLAFIAFLSLVSACSEDLFTPQFRADLPDNIYLGCKKKMLGKVVNFRDYFNVVINKEKGVVKTDWFYVHKGDPFVSVKGVANFRVINNQMWVKWARYKDIESKSLYSWEGSLFDSPKIYEIDKISLVLKEYSKKSANSKYKNPKIWNCELFENYNFYQNYLSEVRNILRKKTEKEAASFVERIKALEQDRLDREKLEKLRKAREII